MRRTRRAGGSLAELLVALTLFAIGGSLATRLLFRAGLEVETAELGLRATLFLSELHDELDAGGQGWPGDERTRPAGPGVLVSEGTDEAGLLRARFEPPGDAGSENGEPPTGPGGFRAPRSWAVGARP